MTPNTARPAAAMLLAWTILSAAPAYADLAPLTRELDKVGQNVCKALDLKCEKSKTTARKKAQTRGAAEAAAGDGIKTNTSKPAEAAAAVEPKSPLAAPVPRPRPAGLVRRAPAAQPAPAPPPLPRAKPLPAVALLPSAPARKPTADTPENAISGEECLAALRTGNVEFETVATPVSNGLCQVDVPVRLHAVPTPRGLVVLPDNPTLNCRFARRFTLWLSDAGAAIVSARMNTTLAKVSTGPGYECRGRNGDASAKLSEHAFGNAVDISTIVTADGRTILVSDAVVTGSAAFPLLRGLRTTACGYFTTVLGPGANAAHASHFHFDMGLHGKSDAYRVCQ